MWWRSRYIHALNLRPLPRRHRWAVNSDVCRACGMTYTDYKVKFSALSWQCAFWQLRLPRRKR